MRFSPADRFGFDVERTIYLTVLHRLMVSGSDRHASRWHQGFRIPGAEDLTLDHAYLAMAWLGEEIADGRIMTDAIEEDLYRRRQELFGEVSIAFFDTTSLYFEGAGGETLGQLGHSKDYRPHLKQVVLGMVLDGDDRPFASFLWPGNTADVTRLMPVWRHRHPRSLPTLGANEHLAGSPVDIIQGEGRDLVGPQAELGQHHQDGVVPPPQRRRSIATIEDLLNLRGG